MVCRYANDICDQPEYCDGMSASCPRDMLRARGDVCRPQGGMCDVVEACWCDVLA